MSRKTQFIMINLWLVGKKSILEELCVVSAGMSRIKESEYQHFGSLVRRKQFT